MVVPRGCETKEAAHLIHSLCAYRFEDLAALAFRHLRIPLPAPPTSFDTDVKELELAVWRPQCKPVVCTSLPCYTAPQTTEARPMNPVMIAIAVIVLTMQYSIPGPLGIGVLGA